MSKFSTITKRAKQSSSQLPTNTDLEDYIQHSYINSVKKVVNGVITHINRDKELVYIDVGLKSEGIIPLNEFFQANEKNSIEVGQTVEVFLEKLDTKAGGIAISRAKAIRERSWEIIKEKFSSANPDDHIVEGVVFSRVKGGLSVDIKGVIAFLPGSQLDVRPIKNIAPLVGHLITYKILSIDEKNQSLILSRKEIIEREKSGERAEFLSSVKEGSVIKGVVKNITNYGAFIDLGNVDGLLHITDIGWTKISHPSEKLKIGQEVKVKIIKHDLEKDRLSLGMKQLEPNPWENILELYPIGVPAQDILSQEKSDNADSTDGVGQVKGKTRSDQIENPDAKDNNLDYIPAKNVVKGKVTNITDYGAFVELQPGIEGLLHISELTWAKDAYRVHKTLKIGQPIEGIILDIDIEKHRIALSAKKLLPNPWKQFEVRHTVNDVLEGIIRNITEFGIFVGIEGTDIDGLVHVSDMSWSGDAAKEMAKYEKGQHIKVIYLGTDIENQRIRFGMKQFQEDPFEKNKSLLGKDQIVSCKVVAIKNDGIEVEVVDGIKCFIKKNNLAKDNNELKFENITEGQTINAKVLSFDASTRKLSLSVRALEEEENQATMKDYSSTGNVESEPTAFSEALQVAMKDHVSTSSEEDEKDKASE